MIDIISKKTGNWSAKSTWEGEVLPGLNDTVIINHTVTLNQNATVAAITVTASGVLKFATTKGKKTLQSSGNIVIQGLLQMKPAASTDTHVIRFINVDEN